MIFSEFIEWFSAFGMSSVAAVLLWQNFKERGEFIRALKATSITNVGFQQMVIALTVASPSERPDSPAECAVCREKLEVLTGIVERQRVNLEKEL